MEEGMTWKDLIATIICFAVAFFIAWLCAKSERIKQKDEDYAKEDFEYHEHRSGKVAEVLGAGEEGING
jgi:hypothetical protein